MTVPRTVISCYFESRAASAGKLPSRVSHDTTALHELELLASRARGQVLSSCDQSVDSRVPCACLATSCCPLTLSVGGVGIASVGLSGLSVCSSSLILSILGLGITSIGGVTGIGSIPGVGVVRIGIFGVGIALALALALASRRLVCVGVGVVSVGIVGMSIIGVGTGVCCCVACGCAWIVLAVSPTL